MRLVIVESPYSAPTIEQISIHISYARECLRDCLSKGEAPFASHLLYTQPGVLDDTIQAQRNLGMAAGWAWFTQADLLVVYTDLGISPGMKDGIDAAKMIGLPMEYRKLKP